MARLKDVALEANVSVMTVSNVVNGRGVVAEATRERVTEAMERLGYRVNRAAQSLRTGRTGVIGLALPDVDSWYMAHLTSRIADTVAQRGLKLAIELTGASRAGELESLAHSRRLMYDGLILSVVGLDQAELNQLHSDQPVVILGEGIPDAQIDRVSLPNFEGSRLAGEHLVARGCRRFALIAQEADEPSGFTTLRIQGFLSALESAGIPPADTEVVHASSYSPAGGVEAARELLARPGEVDGVFAATDSLAVGVVRGFADAGYRVPDDVLVVGFDDVDESQYIVPSLTTVDAGIDRVAHSAVELLLQRIEEGPDAPPRERIHPPRLVVRESSTRR